MEALGRKQSLSLWFLLASWHWRVTRITLLQDQKLDFCRVNSFEGFWTYGNRFRGLGLRYGVRQGLSSFTRNQMEALGRKKLLQLWFCGQADCRRRPDFYNEVYWSQLGSKWMNPIFPAQVNFAISFRKAFFLLELKNLAHFRAIERLSDSKASEQTQTDTAITYACLGLGLRHGGSSMTGCFYS